MCIDFTDLNKACPKDSYPLPIIDALVDNVMAFSRSSSWMFGNMVRKFMDEMSKVLLRVVVTLKVHEEYGKKGGSASPLIDGEGRLKPRN